MKDAGGRRGFEEMRQSNIAVTPTHSRRKRGMEGGRERGKGRGQGGRERRKEKEMERGREQRKASKGEFWIQELETQRT